MLASTENISLSFFSEAPRGRENQREGGETAHKYSSYLTKEECFLCIHHAQPAALASCEQVGEYLLLYIVPNTSMVIWAWAKWYQRQETRDIWTSNTVI